MSTGTMQVKFEDVRSSICHFWLFLLPSSKLLSFSHALQWPNFLSFFLYKSFFLFQNFYFHGRLPFRLNITVQLFNDPGLSSSFLRLHASPFSSFHFNGIPSLIYSNLILYILKCFGDHVGIHLCIRNLKFH